MSASIRMRTVPSLVHTHTHTHTPAENNAELSPSRPCAAMCLQVFAVGATDHSLSLPLSFSLWLLPCPAPAFSVSHAHSLTLWPIICYKHFARSSCSSTTTLHAPFHPSSTRSCPYSDACECVCVFDTGYSTYCPNCPFSANTLLHTSLPGHLTRCCNQHHSVGGNRLRKGFGPLSLGGTLCQQCISLLSFSVASLRSQCEMRLSSNCISHPLSMACVRCHFCSLPLSLTLSFSLSLVLA